jgi:HSP20 family protein
MFGSISQWDGDILNHFNRLEREMADLFGYSSGPASIRAVAHGSYPAINLGSTDDGVEVYVFAAGINQDQLELSIQQNLLTVSGECPDRQPESGNAYIKERYTGQFKRSLSLPEDIDPESATARYTNGVLHISLKRRAEARARKIQVN